MRLWGFVPLSASRSLRLRGVATLGAVLLALTACTSTDAGSGATEEHTGHDAASEMPAVDAEFGGGSDMEFSDAAPPEGLQVEVLEEGTGEPVAEDAAVLANYAGHVWGESEPFDSSFERGAPSLFPLTGVVQGWTEGIPGHAEGSRLLISIPPEYGYGESGNPGAGIGGEDTIVFVIDVLGAANPDEGGQSDAEPVSDPEELPVSIEGELGGPATVTVDPDAPEPDDETVRVIAEGTGEPLAAGDSVAVGYAITTWDNSEQHSTWPGEGESSGAPEVGNLGSGMWYDLLIDIPAGSRVLITAPGDGSSPGVALLADIILVQQA